MNTTAYPLVWDLDVLGPDPAICDFTELADRFEKDLRALAAAAESLPAIAAATAADWVKFLATYQDVISRRSELGSLVGCHAAADAENGAYQKWEARLAALEPLTTQVDTAIETAVQQAGETELDALLAADPRLAELSFFFRDLKRRARLRLPAQEEQLAADLAVDGLHAWGRLYDRVSGALRVKLMERGEIVERSPGQVQFDSPAREVRENNFYAADKAWAGIAPVCAEALNHIAGTRLTLYRRLGLRDHLDAPLIYNRMERETLETMWSVISERKRTLLDYLQTKSRLLGIDRPAWYDLQAPLTGAGDSHISYDAACTHILAAFAEFSGELGDFAEKALREGWIEAENREGKRQGGFCTGFPRQQQSRIFMTFTDSSDSMSTLAHELGHAYHSHVLRDQPYVLQNYPMNLAETASTFAEAVLGESRLAQAGSPTAQLQILDGLLSDAVAFLMNIHARFLFEDEFHRVRARGELDVEALSELMLNAQQEAYLDGLAEDGWNPRFWVSKLHFYISELPFYNFPYTFGYLLSLGVYAFADELGDEFPARYRELLLATGCQNAEDAVHSTLGLDLREPDFWNRSLDIVDRRVQQFVTAAETLNAS